MILLLAPESLSGSFSVDLLLCYDARVQTTMSTGHLCFKAAAELEAVSKPDGASVRALSDVMFWCWRDH